MTERRYGAGQSNPEGWTLAELKNPSPGFAGVAHRANCCHAELIAEVEHLRAVLDEIAKGRGVEPPMAAERYRSIAHAALNHAPESHQSDQPTG